MASLERAASLSLLVCGGVMFAALPVAAASPDGGWRGTGTPGELCKNPNPFDVTAAVTARRLAGKVARGSLVPGSVKGKVDDENRLTAAAVMPNGLSIRIRGRFEQGRFEGDWYTVGYPGCNGNLAMVRIARAAAPVAQASYAGRWSGRADAGDACHKPGTYAVAGTIDDGKLGADLERGGIVGGGMLGEILGDRIEGVGVMPDGLSFKFSGTFDGARVSGSWFALAPCDGSFELTRMSGPSMASPPSPPPISPPPPSPPPISPPPISPPPISPPPISPLSALTAPPQPARLVAGLPWLDERAPAGRVKPPAGPSGAGEPATIREPSAAAMPAQPAALEPPPLPTLMQDQDQAVATPVSPPVQPASAAKPKPAPAPAPLRAVPPAAPAATAAGQRDKVAESAKSPADTIAAQLFQALTDFGGKRIDRKAFWARRAEILSQLNRAAFSRDDGLTVLQLLYRERLISDNELAQKEAEFKG